jgi:hypothetical protein
VWSELQQHQRQFGKVRMHELALVDMDELDEDATPETRSAAHALAERMIQHHDDAVSNRALDAVLAGLRVIVDQVLSSDAERVACESCWQQGVAPRLVATRHPTLFADAGAVSQTLRNVLRRIQRHPDTAALLDTWSKKS